MTEAYEPRAVLDLTMDSENGIEIEFSNRPAAVAFRFRLYAVRSKDRRESRKAYEPGHPLRGKSPYDIITVILGHRREDGSTTMMLKAHTDGLPPFATAIKEL